MCIIGWVWLPFMCFSDRTNECGCVLWIWHECPKFVASQGPLIGFFLRVCSARVRLKVLLTFLLLLVCWWSQLCDLPSCAAAHALCLVCKAFARCRVSCLRFGGYLCTLTCSCSDHVNSSLGRKLNNIAMSRFVSAFLGGLCNVGMCVGVVVCVVFSMVWLCFPCQTLPCSATLCSTCLRLCSRTYRTMFLSFGWCVISPFRFF